MRRQIRQVAGPVPALPGLEHLGGNGRAQRRCRPPRRTARRRGSAVRRARRPHRGERPGAAHRGAGRAPRAPKQRHRRTRPRARRRPGARRRLAARRRSGHRQVHPAAASARQSVRRTAGALYQRRGVRRAGGAACPTSGPERRAGAADGRNAAGGHARRVSTRPRCRAFPRRAFPPPNLPHRAREEQSLPPHGWGGSGWGCPPRGAASECEHGGLFHRSDRLHPDGLHRGAVLGAGVGVAGARMRGATHPRGQGQRHHPGAGRPRHQGRRARRAACAGAHGRYRAVFRGRHAVALPADSRHQEPLRRGERTGRVRHDRAWPQRRVQPLGHLPLHPRRAGARHLRARHTGGHPPAVGGGAGAGGQRRRAQPAPPVRGAGRSAAGHAAGRAASPCRSRQRRSGRVRQRRGRGAHHRARGRSGRAAGHSKFAAQPPATAGSAGLR